MDVAILTGAGRRFLRRGRPEDLHPADDRDASPLDIREIVELGLNGFTRGMHRIPKPIVAAVNGWALAGGLEDGARLRHPRRLGAAMFGSFEASAASTTATAGWSGW